MNPTEAIAPVIPEIRSTNPDTLIILGKGPCRGELKGMLEQWPNAEIWTLNNFFAQKQDPKLPWFGPAMSHRHFDIHHDQRFWDERHKLRGDCPFVVSPFRQPIDDRMERFPLDDIAATFGTPVYMECTLCYMLALACLHVAEWSDGKWTNGSWTRIALPGCDMGDATHFAYRFGTHYWLGIARGLGLDIELTRSSHLLRRYAHLRSERTEEIFHHIYGQPWDVTEPVAAKYGWA